MTFLVLAILAVLVINLGLLLAAVKLSQRVSPQWRGGLFGSAEAVRLAVLFLAGHFLWWHEKNPVIVVTYIFIIAIVQMTLQIQLLIKGKI